MRSVARIADVSINMVFKLAADAGRDVVASAGGRVVFADWMTGYGLIVIVDHGGDTMSAERVDDCRVGAGDVGDDHAAHRRTSVTCGK